MADALAQVCLIWRSAGHPGQAKFRAAAQCNGLISFVREAADFVRAQPVAQVFAPPPKSEGKVTAAELNSGWQCDLVDHKTKSPEKRRLPPYLGLCRYL